MLNNQFFSPLVCSTVRVGCCAGAEAIAAEKRENNLNSVVDSGKIEQTQLCRLGDEVTPVKELKQIKCDPNYVIQICKQP